MKWRFWKKKLINLYYYARWGSYSWPAPFAVVVSKFWGKLVLSCWRHKRGDEITQLPLYFEKMLLYFNCHSRPQNNYYLTNAFSKVIALNNNTEKYDPVQISNHLTKQNYRRWPVTGSVIVRNDLLAPFKEIIWSPDHENRTRFAPQPTLCSITMESQRGIKRKCQFWQENTTGIQSDVDLRDHHLK